MMHILSRRYLRIVAAGAVLSLGACSEVKLSNNRVTEDHAGQDGYDVTHQVTERHWQRQSGATGPAVSEVSGGLKPDQQAGAVTAVENTGTQEIIGTRDNSRNGVKQQQH